MERWTRTMIRYRWLVLAVWTVVLRSFRRAAMAGLADLLTNRFTLPGTDTHRAETILEDHFGQKSTGSFTIVVAGRAGLGGSGSCPRSAARAARAAAELPTGRSPASQPVSDAVVDARRSSRTSSRPTRRATPTTCARPSGRSPARDVYVTGQAAIEHDLDPVFAHDLRSASSSSPIPIALADPRLRLRDARLPAPVPLRARRDPDDARRSSGSSRTSWS